jgi:hypothetical protein
VKSPAEGFRPGDVIVTAVARHYSIGRIQLGGIQEYLSSTTDRGAAVKLACDLAGGTHRVFLAKDPGQSTLRMVDCEELPVTGPPGKAV